VQISWEFTPPHLSTGISNLLQPAQAEVVLSQLSTYIASRYTTTVSGQKGGRDPVRKNKWATEEWYRNSWPNNDFPRCLNVDSPGLTDLDAFDWFYVDIPSWSMFFSPKYLIHLHISTLHTIPNGDGARQCISQPPY
jgi:hypothetical protein